MLSQGQRSASGNCTFIGGKLVTWRSKKQNVAARSSAEAEFRGWVQSYDIKHLQWITGLLKELWLELNEPVKIYCDNKAAISIAHNPIQHDRTKHVEVDWHFIKEKIEAGQITTPFVSTKQQLKDIFTKGLPFNTFDPIVSMLGMHNLYAPAWGEVLETVKIKD